MPVTHYEVLKQKIESQEHLQVAVVGLGYVGLPLAMEVVTAGYRVLGIDVDHEKIQDITSRADTLCGLPMQQVRQYITDHKLKVTHDTSQLSQADVVVICVPTPLRKTRDPDLSYVCSVLDELVKYHSKPQLVILESTTYPGFTREVVVPRLEEKGRIDEDWFVAFSPERIDPGNKHYDTHTTPKIIGAVSKLSNQLTCQLYQRFIAKIESVSSTDVAEFSKLLENTFRAVNIGLVNEMAIMARKLNINIWEVIDAAASKPFGFMPFYPGPGLGGHCIPIDPHYLSWKLRALQHDARFIEMAASINRSMIEYVVGLVQNALNESNHCINGSNIMALGVAYKADVSDTRESPALEVMTELEKRGAQLSYHDPYVPSVKIRDNVLDSQSLHALSTADCIVLLTNHSCFDLESLCSNRDLLIIDTRGATRHIGNTQANIVLL